MRHTDMKLMMRYYTDLRLLDASGAVQNLPELKGRGEAAEKVTLKRTGTDDVGTDKCQIEDAPPAALIREFPRPDGAGACGRVRGKRKPHWR